MVGMSHLAKDFSMPIDEQETENLLTHAHINQLNTSQEWEDD
jgi:hypothetical protein